MYAQKRGIPQGAVLSPVLFIILMGSIPHQDVHTCLCGWDRIFCCGRQYSQSIPGTTVILISPRRVAWWIHLHLNVWKCSVLPFPMKDPIHNPLSHHIEHIPQVEQLEYLRVLYDRSMSRKAHIEHIASKGVRAVYLWRKISQSIWHAKANALINILHASSASPWIWMHIIRWRSCL